MLPFNFPVWVFVNKEKHPADGYPYYLLTRGGGSIPLPTTLPVFTTEENAKHFALHSPVRDPFEAVAVDFATFCEILDQCRDLEDVGLDIGTPDAVPYRIEKLLTMIEPNQ